MRAKTKKKSKKKLATMKKAAATSGALFGWQWSPRREHDGKSFGNPALYATPQTVASLVRETGQNSLDVAVGKTVSIRYRLIDLPAGSLRRQKFENRLQLNQSLRSHLDAVAKSKQTQSSVRIGKALQELDKHHAVLRLLVVEDYATRGLAGDEFDSQGNFSALVRDVENSHKSESTAGGSFGLGSKTLWSCSGLLTVIFASKIDGETHKGIRTIGKADLGYHALQNGSPYGYIGPGFFGNEYKEGGAISTWHGEDDAFLADLCLVRKSPVDNQDTGTSALIVAFDDPESDEENSQEILEKVRSAVARNFWPAIKSGALRVFVRHEIGDMDETAQDEEVSPDKYVPSFIDAYDKHMIGDVQDRLRHAGDVVSVPITQAVPATRPEGGVQPSHGEIAAESRLIIRLADDLSVDRDLLDTVAMARGRAMVTQYMSRRGVALNARPFHAFLITGTLAGGDDNQQAAERFLRHAEPPSHDEWKLWSGLKARYSHGAGKRLEELFRDVTSTLARFVAVKPEASDDGPDALKRLLAIPSVVTAKASSWRISAGSISIDGDDVVFNAHFEIDKPESQLFLPRLHLAAESGNVALAITDLIINGEPAATAGLALSKSTKRLDVSGRAVCSIKGLDLNRCALRISASLTRTESKNVNS